MKVADDAAIGELPLNDERKPEAKKHGRRVNFAIAHMQKDLDSLNAKINKLTEERDGIAAAIEALG